MPVRLRPYTARYLAVRDGVLRFQCKRCGRCCSTGPNVAITSFDLVRIALFLRVDPLDLLGSYVRVVVADVIPFMVLEGEGGVCRFLERSTSGLPVCVVYPVRPLRCRLYPLLVEGGGLYLDPSCPGVGDGREAIVPWRLVERYNWERRSYYSRLVELVLGRGLEPLEALEKVIGEDYEEARRGVRWASPDYLDELGTV